MYTEKSHQFSELVKINSLKAEEAGAVTKRCIEESMFQ